MKKILIVLLACLLLSKIALAQHIHHSHGGHSNGLRIASKGLAVIDTTGKFEYYKFTRHALGDKDILVEFMYSGVCHSDISVALGHWRPVVSYPMVPGHEMAGRVTQVGKNVTKFKVGDYAGIGAIVNSCGECQYCLEGLEQFCEKGLIGPYGVADPYHNGEMTQGGYANNMVISEDYALTIPKGADLSKVGPLLCAGVTVYSPIKYAGVKKGDKVGIAGFGGLGHLALQYAVKLGAEVTVFDITEEKRQFAMDMGAVKYVNVNDPKQLEGMRNSFDFILSTIPSAYDLTMYLNMVKVGGDFTIVGNPSYDISPSLTVRNLIGLSRRKVSGSVIGGIAETQEVLDYSVANNIYPMVELIDPTVKNIEMAFKNVVDGEVYFRYVMDMSKLK